MKSNNQYNVQSNRGNQSIDLGAIMRYAWQYRRAAAEGMRCKVSEVLWGVCLEEAWVWYRREHADDLAAAYVARLRRLWDAQDRSYRVGPGGYMTSAQTRWTQASVLRVALNWIKYTEEDRYPQGIDLLTSGDIWRQVNYSINDFINSTIAALLARLSPRGSLINAIALRYRQGERVKVTLGSVLYGCARQQIMPTLRRVAPLVGVAGQSDDPDAEDRDPLGRIPMSGLAADTAGAGVTLAQLDDLRRLLTERQAQVLSYLLVGCSEAEIGRALGIAAKNVHKHIILIRRKALRVGLRPAASN